MIVRCIGLVVLVLLSASASAAIIVTPNAPLSTQVIRVALVEQYGSEASITSASIARSGNQFLVAQAVEVICSLPNAPTLTSEFNVGALPAGTYSVVAQTQYTSPVPGCSVSPLAQSASFTVSDPVGVPTSNPVGYMLVASFLALCGVWHLRHRSG